MTTAALPRISPLRAVRGDEIDLPYAPAPWQLKQCKQTGIVFLANPPAYEALSRDFAYEVTFEKECKARRRAEPIRYAISSALKRFRGHVLKRNKSLSLVQRLMGDSRSARINVLDVGCGWGSLLDELFKSLPAGLRRKSVPHGIEISQELSRISDQKLRKAGGRCVHASAMDGLAQFDDNYFDVIIMASFLEHDINPLTVLERSAARLKPGGSILVKVPNYNCFNRYVRGRRWCGFRWPDHVNYFTPETLKATAELAGLRTVRMSLLDRSPLSDNMYAILRRAPVIAPLVPTPAPRA
ncbi:MAG TPA: class I SAM-dependent methyltransferase [Duganella sp.]|jgi:2-polyprenyl-3-methyl-5-hydroxy-6-metoxy-1,4-benzoquinol methylase